MSGAILVIKTIGLFDFQVIKHHADYINFSITFAFDKHYCDVTGMGWMAKNKANYHLSSILINKKEASLNEAAEIGVSVVKNSAAFEFVQLDHLTKTYIKTNLVKKSR